MNDFLHRCWQPVAVGWLALGSVACGSPFDALNAVTPDRGYERRSVAYGEADRQQLDVYRATAPVVDRATIVFVYGGAWRSGKRTDYEFVAGTLAAAGHDVIVPDYRLYPEVSWPDFVADVAAAVQHVAGDADALLGRPLGDIVLMGHSSGAHSAALLAAEPARWWPTATPTVRGLIGLSGPYDLPLANPEVAQVFAEVTDRDSVKLPALAGPAHPPALLLYGGDDRRVKPLHSERYAEALAAAGVPVQLERLDGVGHAAIVAEFAAPLDLLNDASERTLQWLETLPVATQADVQRDAAPGG